MRSVLHCLAVRVLCQTCSLARKTVGLKGIRRIGIAVAFPAQQHIMPLCALSRVFHDTGDSARGHRAKRSTGDLFFEFRLMYDAAT